MADPALSQILGRRAHWLLEWDVGGRIFKFSDTPATPIDATGAEHRYVEGLAPLNFTLAPGSDGSSTAITISSNDDWALLVAQGVDLEERPCTLRHWFDGQILETARVVLKGRSVDVEYGSVNEPVTFTLSEHPEETSLTIPTSQMVVDGVTWTGNPDESIVGAYYPIVIGAPGNTPTGANQPAVPALFVDNQNPPPDDILLIAGHRVRATTVDIYEYEDTLTLENRTVLEIEDGLGRTISYVNSQGTALNFSDGVKFYTAWDVDNGGLPNSREDGLLRGLGDVIIYLLQEWSNVRVDFGRMRAQAPLLNRFRVDTFINDPTKSLAFIDGEIVPLFPIQRMRSDRGLWYQFLNWDATSQVDAITNLSADRGQIQRRTSVRKMDNEIANEITVEFQPNATSRLFRTRRVVTAQAGRLGTVFGGTNDNRILPDARCRISQERLRNETGDSGIRYKTVQAPHVWSTDTALLIARSKAAELALPKRTVGYTGGQELARLYPGAIVTLTDSEISLTDHVCMISELTLGGPDVAVSLILLDDPTQITRTTA